MGTMSKQNQRDENLLADLIAGGMNLRELAQKHGMTLGELGSWMMSDQVYAWLKALCVLADFQTQLILSQHRVAAAATLINIAGSEVEGTEVKRKACVDALRLNMPRIDPRGETKEAVDLKPLPVEVIREMVYGKDKAKPQDAAPAA